MSLLLSRDMEALGGSALEGRGNVVSFALGIWSLRVLEESHEAGEKY